MKNTASVCRQGNDAGERNTKAESLSLATLRLKHISMFPPAFTFIRCSYIIYRAREQKVQNINLLHICKKFLQWPFWCRRLMIHYREEVACCFGAHVSREGWYTICIACMTTTKAVLVVLVLQSVQAESRPDQCGQQRSVAEGKENTKGHQKILLKLNKRKFHKSGPPDREREKERERKRERNNPNHLCHQNHLKKHGTSIIYNLQLCVCNSRNSIPRRFALLCLSVNFALPFQVSCQLFVNSITKEWKTQLDRSFVFALIWKEDCINLSGIITQLVPQNTDFNTGSDTRRWRRKHWKLSVYGSHHPVLAKPDSKRHQVFEQSVFKTLRWSIPCSCWIFMIFVQGQTQICPTKKRDSRLLLPWAELERTHRQFLRQAMVQFEAHYENICLLKS